MKINKKYLEELDLVIRFYDKTIVCSDNLSALTSVLNIGHNCQNIVFSFINNNKENATFTKYSLKINDDEVTIEAEHKLLISVHDEGLKFNFDGTDVDVSKLAHIIKKNFILSNNIDYQLYQTVQDLSFNCHKNRLGLSDVFCKLRDDYKSYCTSGFDYLKYFYYYSTPKMYAVAERLIKLGMENDIRKYNPAISHKPIPDANDIKSLSAVSKEIIKNNESYSDLNLIEIMTNLEMNPNVGVNGIKMLKEVVDIYNDIKLPYECNVNLYIRFDAEMLNDFDDITRRFNISAKTLINRMIKASFYEELSISQYIDLCSDYVRISKLLDLEIPTKMPKDIVKAHDLVASQYEYIKNKEIEKKFKEHVSKNKLLLDTLPEDETLTIISPETPNDLINEGLNMGHCVGTYVERYAAGISKIFFVRRKEDVEKSYVTIELNRHNKLVQARGFCNSTPAKEVFDFIEDWICTL